MPPRKAGSPEYLNKAAAVRFQEKNPKKRGCAAGDRYEAYKHARTVGEALEAGAWTADLKHDYSKGFMELLAAPSGAAAAPSSAPAAAAGSAPREEAAPASPVAQAVPAQAAAAPASQARQSFGLPPSSVQGLRLPELREATLVERVEARRQAATGSGAVEEAWQAASPPGFRGARCEVISGFSPARSTASSPSAASNATPAMAAAGRDEPRSPAAAAGPQGAAARPRSWGRPLASGSLCASPGSGPSSEGSGQVALEEGQDCVSLRLRLGTIVVKTEPGTEPEAALPPQAEQAEDPGGQGDGGEEDDANLLAKFFQKQREQLEGQEQTASQEGREKAAEQLAEAQLASYEMNVSERQGRESRERELVQQGDTGPLERLDEDFMSCLYAGEGMFSWLEDADNRGLLFRYLVLRSQATRWYRGLAEAYFDEKRKAFEGLMEQPDAALLVTPFLSEETEKVQAEIFAMPEKGRFVPRLFAPVESGLCEAGVDGCVELE